MSSTSSASPRFRTITLLGSSSGRNAGDAALIAAIMDGVDAACGRKLRYEIPTINPKYIRNMYPNDSVPVGMMPWQGALRMLGLPTLNSVRRADAVLVFDACLFDRSLYNPMFNFMSSIRLLAPQAKKRGIPFIGFNMGLGPVYTDAGKKMLREVIDLMDFITVRDQGSLDLLHEVGAKNPKVRLAADAALNAPSWTPEQVAPIFERAGIKIDEPKLCINVNRYIDSWASAEGGSIGKENFVKVYRDALVRFTGEVKVPVVFVTTQHHDIEITQALIDALPESVRRVRVDNREIGHAGVKGVFRHCDLLCGMRLHSLILASSELTPVVGITYKPKVDYYFSQLERPGDTLSFKDFSAGALGGLLLRGWAEKENIRSGLERMMPVLKARAAWSAELIAGLDQGAGNFESVWDRGPALG